MVPQNAIRQFSSRAQAKVQSQQKLAVWQVQKRAYSGVGHELPILDTHHLFRVVATCSVVAALSNAWFSGSGVFGDVSTHVALLHGNPQMRTAGLVRMQRVISQKEGGICLQELRDSGAFDALINLMRTEQDVVVWRQLCRTMAEICDSPLLYQELASSRICTVLSQRLTSQDEEFQSAAVVLVHKLVSHSGMS